MDKRDCVEVIGSRSLALVGGGFECCALFSRLYFRIKMIGGRYG